MNKSNRLFLRTVYIIILCIVVLIIVAITINNNNCLITDNMTFYTSGDYKKFNGGEEASKFLPEFDTLMDFIDINFSYKDYGKKIHIKKGYTSFYLDIKYEHNQYVNEKEKLLKYTDNPQALYNTLGDYVVAPVTVENELFKDNFAAICYNDNVEIIRYVFIYKYKYKKGENMIPMLPRINNTGWMLK